MVEGRRQVGGKAGGFALEPRTVTDRRRAGESFRTRYPRAGSVDVFLVSESGGHWAGDRGRGH
jgi:hypothetical protein